MDLGNRFSDWDFYKSKYEETDSLFLMSTPGPVLMILAVYLLFVLKVGPAIMEKRKPFILTKTLVIYNAAQVIFSAYLVQKYYRELLRTGLFPKTCYVDDATERKEILFGVWLYFIAKICEFFDTIFFVLRKKYNQVTFLHLYHHSIMMIGTWGILKYAPSHILYYIGFINSLVHVFMYTYYGVAALGPNYTKYIFWKKHITKFQLVQFVTVIIHYITNSKVSDCPPSTHIATFMIANTFMFLLLFLNFYVQNYIKKTK